MVPCSLRAVVLEVTACLERAGQGSQIRDLLKEIISLNIPDRRPTDSGGCVPTHSELLSSAISSISDTRFSDLKSALVDAKNQLFWRVDDGGFYAEGADVGEGYKNGNMHTLLIGPRDSLIAHSGLLLGLFLLAPNTLYRDHKHLAPEFYLPLTGPSGWRFDLGDWQDCDAGTLIYNEPNRVHATRVYEVPFLAIFAWTRDISSACRVVFSDDWAAVEADLKGSTEIRNR